MAASTGADDALAKECSTIAEDEIAAGRLTAGIDHLLWGSRIAAGREIAALREVIARPDFGLHPELFGPVTSSMAIVCAYAGQGAEAIEWARRSLEADQPLATVEVTAKQAVA